MGGFLRRSGKNRLSSATIASSTEATAIIQSGRAAGPRDRSQCRGNANEYAAEAPVHAFCRADIGLNYVCRQRSGTDIPLNQLWSDGSFHSFMLFGRCPATRRQLTVSHKYVLRLAGGG